MDPIEQLPQYIVLMEDDLLHTAENGYCCGDPTCSCASGSDEDTIVEGSLTSIVDETGQVH